MSRGRKETGIFGIFHLVSENPWPYVYGSPSLRSLCAEGSRRCRFYCSTVAWSKERTASCGNGWCCLPLALQSHTRSLSASCFSSTAHRQRLTGKHLIRSMLRLSIIPVSTPKSSTLWPAFSQQPAIFTLSLCHALSHGTSRFQGLRRSRSTLFSVLDCSWSQPVAYELTTL